MIKTGNGGTGNPASCSGTDNRPVGEGGFPRTFAFPAVLSGSACTKGVGNATAGRDAGWVSAGGRGCFSRSYRASAA